MREGSAGHINEDLREREKDCCPLESDFPYECFRVPGSVARSWDLEYGPAAVLVPLKLVNEWITQY